MHGETIKLAIRLCTGAANGRTLLPIQHTELDACRICDPTHQAVKRVNLANQMTLAQTTNCRITGHHTNRIALMSDQGCLRAPAGSRSRSFAARMSTTHDYHVICLIEHCQNLGIAVSLAHQI
ncbi:hypothetical protein GGD50_005553 [Rhizobium paranaense]|uniref:Uncharacterized protein n=1 Tax=Rhizobium paranaense TaxID=1650438 RepID=A0A7W9D4G0_9HYPH|nr:hypothetical protein [Rhizobium paranaense]